MTQTNVNLRILPDGRVVVPASLTGRLGWRPGDTLLISVQADSLVLKRRDTMVARADGLHNEIPLRVSLVDGLLPELRAEERRIRDV